MPALTGALVGALAGVAVWWYARFFIAGHSEQPTVSVPPGSTQVAVSPPTGDREGVLLHGAPPSTPARLSPLEGPFDSHPEVPVRHGTAGDFRMNSRPSDSSPRQALAVCCILTAWGAYVGWRALVWPVAVGGLLVTAVLLTIGLVDVRVRRIPNPLVALLLAWAVVQSRWLGQPALDSLVVGLLVAGGFFLLLALLSRGAMGLGDVKLAAASGALLGWPVMTAALILGIVAGGVAAVVLLVTRRAGRRDTMAYGPYLALGTWVVYGAFLGLWHWPTP